MEEVSENNFDKVGSFDGLSKIFTLGIFLLILGFLPRSIISVEILKNFFFVSFLLLFLFLFLVQFIRGKIPIIFLKNPTSYILAILGVFLLTSFFLSDFSSMTFSGIGYEVGTAASLVSFLLVIFISSIIYRELKNALLFFSILVIMALFVFIVSVADIFFIDIFEPGITILGTWINLAIFSSFFGIVAVVALDLFPLPRIFKVFLFLVLLFSFFISAVVFFKPVFIVNSIAALLLISFLIYRHSAISELKTTKKMRTPWFALLFLIFSFTFFWFSGSFSALTSFEKIQEIRPSFGVTKIIISSTVQEGTKNALIGSGPHTFSRQWELYKPAAINETPLQNESPIHAYGLIPTLGVTTGLLGLLLWLFLIFSFFVLGLISIGARKLIPTPEYYVLLTSFLVGLSGWVWFFLYVPNIVVLSIVATMTGIFLSSLERLKIYTSVQFNFPKKGRVLTFFLLPPLLGVFLFVGYGVVSKFLSFYFYQKAIVVYQEENDYIAANSLLNNATGLYAQDFYYRTLSELQQQKMEELITQEANTTREQQDAFQLIVQSGIDNAKKATQLNQEDYRNWITLGNVYTRLLYLGVGGEVQARGAYEKAIEYSPNNPLPQYLLGRLLVGQEITKEEGINHIRRAAELSSSFQEAAILLEQSLEEE